MDNNKPFSTSSSDCFPASPPFVTLIWMICKKTVLIVDNIIDTFINLFIAYQYKLHAKSCIMGMYIFLYTCFQEVKLIFMIMIIHGYLNTTIPGKGNHDNFCPAADNFCPDNKRSS